MKTAKKLGFAGSVGIILRVPLKREQVPGVERLPCIGV